MYAVVGSCVKLWNAAHFRFESLVYTTSVNSTFFSTLIGQFRSEKQVLFTLSSRCDKITPKEFDFQQFISMLKNINLFFGIYVVYSKKLFALVFIKVVDICLAALQLGKSPPLFTCILVNNC